MLHVGRDRRTLQERSSVVQSLQKYGATFTQEAGMQRGSTLYIVIAIAIHIILFPLYIRKCHGKWIFM